MNSVFSSGLASFGMNGFGTVDSRERKQAKVWYIPWNFNRHPPDRNSQACERVQSKDTVVQEQVERSCAKREGQEIVPAIRFVGGGAPSPPEVSMEHLFNGELHRPSTEMRH